jgi:hypothetical protein
MTIYVRSSKKKITGSKNKTSPFIPLINGTDCPWLVVLQIL